MSLLDFSWDNSSSTKNVVGCVKNYGYILDIDTDELTNICGGTRREKLVYKSVSNSVQIVLDQQVLETDYYLISYKGKAEKKFPCLVEKLLCVSKSDWKTLKSSIYVGAKTI